MPSAWLMGWAKSGRGSINRFEGALLLIVYIGYTLVLLRSAGVV